MKGTMIKGLHWRATSTTKICRSAEIKKILTSTFGVNYCKQREHAVTEIITVGK